LLLLILLGPLLLHLFGLFCWYWFCSSQLQPFFSSPYFATISTGPAVALDMLLICPAHFPYFRRHTLPDAL
jgi:hypothetical protein